MGALGILFALVQVAIHATVSYYRVVPVSTWCSQEYKWTDCNGEKGRAAENVTTKLKVVLPSYGQTGTTSLAVALRILGIRAYHADEISIFAKPTFFDEASPSNWARAVSRCRMEGISLEPLTDTLPLVLATSPEAKFVMTWRSYPSWYKSTTGSRKREYRWSLVSALFARSDSVILHWIALWDRLTGQLRRTRLEGESFENITVTAHLYRALCNGYAWPITQHMFRGTFKSGAYEEAYLAHIDEIRQTVPSDRLLEFDVTRHSWPELVNFLGLPGPPAGTPFPRPRRDGMRTNDVHLEENPIVSILTFGTFALLHALNYLVCEMALWGSILAVWLLVMLLLYSIGWRPAIVGAHSRWEAAVCAQPVVAVLEGLEPPQALAVARALAAAGLRAAAVSLRSPRALESFRLLVEGLPEDFAVGAAHVLEPWQVSQVHRAGGTFVLSPNLEARVVRRAKRAGLVSLAGVCTVTEALAALRCGARGLAAFPAEQLAPQAIRAWRAVLPEGTCLVLAGGLEPKAMADFWEAGVRGFMVGAGIFQPGDTPEKARKRAEALLAACTFSTPARSAK